MYTKLSDSSTVQCTCNSRFQVHLPYNVHASPASRYTRHLLSSVHVFTASGYAYYTLHINSQLPGIPAVHCSCIPSFQVHYCILCKILSFQVHLLHTAPASRYNTVHCTCIPSFQVHYCTLYMYTQLPGTLLYTLHTSTASRYTTVHCTCISSFKVHYSTLCI